MVSDERRTELGLQYNWNAERAAEHYLDGYLDEAHVCADRAIAAISELHRSRPDDQAYAEAYADASRNRAEIRTVLGATSPRLLQGGAEDAAKAIELYERGDTGRFPARIAAIRLNLAELLAACGRGQEARRHADAAIADYRRHLDTDGESNATALARALERYADLLPPDSTEARDARVAAVELYRPYARPGTDLWNNRHSRGTTWLSTPTLPRFGATAAKLAAEAGPAESAPAQRDAAMVEAAMRAW